MRIKQPQHFRRFINQIIYDPWHTGHSQSNILLSRKSASSSDGHVPFLMQIAAHNQPSVLKSHKFARRQLGSIEDIVMQSNYLHCSFDKIYEFNRQFYPHTLLSLHSGYEKVLQGRKKGLEYPSRGEKNTVDKFSNVYQTAGILNYSINIIHCTKRTLPPTMYSTS